VTYDELVLSCGCRRRDIIHRTTIQLHSINMESTPQTPKAKNIKILGITAMSTEVEWIFSGAKLIVTDRRYTLKEISKACVFLRHWGVY